MQNTLGNLVNRTISMTNKYLGGVAEDKGAAESVDDDLKSFVLSVPKKVEEKWISFVLQMQLQKYLQSLRDVTNISTRQSLGYSAKMSQRKTDFQQFFTTLLRVLLSVQVFWKSFMPDTTEKILKQLNTTERALEDMDKFGLYESGTKVTDAPEILFMRLDVKEVLAKAEGNSGSAESGRRCSRRSRVR